MSERKINQSATLQKILESDAINSIKNIDSFREEVKDLIFLKEAALLWETEIVYE